ncbi:hypothetical protein Tco_0938054 [Tanacetum coccineum]|uniref:UBN2 domain-containing protein n=1 Tax=Tanacetum coccineum TaxID=301880 RepID=A0ABQ5DM84_9ASTR
MKETSYELLEDDEKKQLGNNNKAKMTLYNALPRKEYERVYMCKTTKESQNSDPDYSSKNHVRKFLHALPLKWRAKVTSIEEAKELATLPLDELVGNLKVYEMIFNEDVDKEEEAEAFNLMARNLRKFFRKGNRFRRGNRFGDGGNRFGKGRGGAWSDSEGGDEPQNDETCLMAIDFQEVQPNPSISNNDLDIIDLQKENEKLLRFNKDFAKPFEKLLKEKRSLENENSKLLSKINDLEFEVNKLENNKEVVEPCKNCYVLTKEVDSLKCNVSRLQDQALKFSKFKKSRIVFT